jgi:hypothetical protein
MAAQEPLSSVEKHRRGLGVFNLMRCVDARSGERDQPIEIGHLSGSLSHFRNLEPGGSRKVPRVVDLSYRPFNADGTLSTRRKSPAEAGLGNGLGRPDHREETGSTRLRVTGF